MNIEKKNYLFRSVSTLKGVGLKLSKYLKNKNIERVNDLLWNLPYTYIDRSEITSLNKLEVGKIATVSVIVRKYNFPRIRNLPNRVNCKDESGSLDIVFFNSREGYIRNVMPLEKRVVVSGKISFFKNKYQITNPDYITSIDKIDYVKKSIPKYSLTEGLTEKSYRKIIEQVLTNLPNIKEWYDKNFLKKMNFLDWKTSLLKMHKDLKKEDVNSNVYRRLAYDEIFSHLLVLSENRKKIKKIKKKSKIFDKRMFYKVVNSLDFKLTKDQEKCIDEIDGDLKSKNRMFRILQGDVGSGKTIVSFLSALNVIQSGYQCSLMAPTEILARQHFNLAKKIFKNTTIKTELLTGKTIFKNKKKIISDLKENKIDFLIGTHSLFQKKIVFNNLGLTIIDEQHKFGVKQRINLTTKGGNDCDVLLMSATPIPRTMMLSMYGDMDVSKINEKPANRKKILTYSKPEKKIDELWPLIKKQIFNGNQVFWVCPLIKESKLLNYSSAIKKFEFIEQKFPKRTGLIHGSMSKEEKEEVLKKFLKKDIDILVSTTVIEVGIDFPNANLIIIENANKFGLAQLHQLRGRVGRGQSQGICILLFKDNLSNNAKKRLKILKKTEDGFLISEEDMRLRGYGDIIGFQQSGLKFFRLADPIHHEDLFKIAETHVKELENKLINTNNYNFLLKLFDKADVINEAYSD
tara:strand:+ start:326 stop:2389 length:2064 start_codon:yes stop_codon:yes gene_type:complete